MFHLKLEKLQVMILDDSDLFSCGRPLHHVNVVHHFVCIQDGIHLQKMQTNDHEMSSIFSIGF